MNVIRSQCNEIYTEEINKIALSSDDDKQVIMADGIHTLTFSIPKPFVLTHSFVILIDQHCGFIMWYVVLVGI